MPGVEQRIFAACRAAALEPTGLSWIAADLSLRRFARVTTTSDEAPTLVARVEVPEDPAGRPAGVPPEPPHEPIRALYEAHGLPVPRRFGGDDDAGIELLEDVGPLSLCDAAAAVDTEMRCALHREACALIPRIQRIPPTPGVAAFARSLDAALLAYKADLVVRYGLAARGRDATPAEATVVRDAFTLIADASRGAPQRLAHRDFQSGNLYVRPDAAPGARLTMIDLQGAFLAPPEYDLVCLLHDSYIELPEAEIAEHLEATLPRLPDAPDTDTAALRFDLLTLSRKGKDHARFLYAATERGDDRFLAYAPATVRMLHRAARRVAGRDARFADLADLLHEIPETPCAR